MLTAVCAVCVCSANANAGEDMSGETALKWTLGGAAIYGDANAIGIDHTKWLGWPIVNAEYGNWNIGTSEGVSYKFINNDNWVLKAGVSYDGGRRSSWLAKSRKGLGEIDEGAMAEVSAKYMFLDGAHVGLAASQSSADGDGVLVTGSFGYKTDIAENMKLGFGVETVWAEDGYMEEYFGIDATQAAATGLAAFSADAGLKHTSVAVNFNYSFAENWDLGVVGGANFLLEDARDSDVAQHEVLPYAKTSLTYKF